MLSKLTIIIFFFSTFLCCSAIAQDSEIEPMYTHLKVGDDVPFDGTLFNGTALSQILVDSQYSFDECDLRIEFEKNILAADYQLKLDILQAGYDSLSERHDLLMLIKDNEIEIYRTMALDMPNKNNHWWLAGGVAVGVSITIAAAWSMGQVSSTAAN